MDLGTLMKFLEYVNSAFINEYMLRFYFQDEIFNQTELRKKIEFQLIHEITLIFTALHLTHIKS